MTTTTFDQQGNALSKQQNGVSYPAQYSFQCVNDFVHSPKTGFEDLQNLCLGLATEIENMKKTKC